MAGEHHSEPTPEITSQAVRQIIETEIEHLIDVLDFLDPDPDLEDVDEDDDKSDFEPSLGSLSENIDQDLWGRFCIGQDLEDEHDGREPCCEDEGTQCEDEGAIDADCEDWQHPEFSDYGGRIPTPPPSPVFKQSTYTVEEWSAAQAEQRRTSMEAAKAINGLQGVMVRHGQVPVPHLRVLAGAIMKG